MRAGKTANIILHIIFILMTVMCLFPLLLVLSISFSSNSSIMEYGYSIIPKEFSLEAYEYILETPITIIRAYGVTIFNTVAGTFLSTLVIALFAYPLSRNDFKFRKAFTYYLLVTMLFSGGTVSWYIVCSNVFHLSNTIIDFNNAIYRADSSNVLKSFVNLVNKSVKTSGEAEKCFRNACALSEIKKASADKLSDLLKKYKEELNITYTPIIESGDASAMRAFTYLAGDRANNPINSVKQLETVLNRAEALGSVNSATRKNMQEIIEKYSKDLGTDINGAYKSVDKYEVIKLLIKENGAEYKSIAEFKNAFNEAVKKVADNERKPVTPGGGGGGGTGGTRGSMSVSPVFSESDPGKEIGTKEEKSSQSEYFDDVFMSDWAQPYIDYAAYKGIMSGDGERHFRPNDKISREEFLKIVIEALKVGKDEAAPATEFSFDDVNREDWFYGYIETGVGFKIINGISEHSFGTGEYLTRQDAAVILMRAKEAAKMVLNDTAAESDFSDKENISDYAADAVLKLQKAGIINGYEDGSFNPMGSITRSEAAKIIYGILKNTNTL